MTNTNWQWYSGEAAIGHLMQMSGLTVQNFVSAGVGMAVAAAFARGLARTENDGRVGNFFADLVRTVLRVLLPISLVAACVLVVFGVIQNFAGDHVMHTLTGGSQTLTGGPVASQEAIKELGTNGGGFYNVNSAHPFENPTPFTNLLEIYLLLLIPFAMAWAFGLIVKDRRQGIAVGGVMALLLSISIGLLTWAEMAAPGTAPQLAGGAMEGKETRFGEAASALFAASTTGTSTGAVNSHARLAHRPGRWRGHVQHDARRDRTGRCGLRPLRHVDAGRRHGLPGRADGRPDAGVPRQEDRPARDRPGGALRAHHADPAAGRHRGSGHLRRRPGGDPQQRSTRLLRDAVRRHLGGQQQRLGVRRASRPARRSGTRCSGSRCSSAGSCR